MDIRDSDCIYKQNLTEISHRLAGLHSWSNQRLVQEWHRSAPIFLADFEEVVTFTEL